MAGPLAGVRVLEFAGSAPTAFVGTVLSGLGADVVRIDRAPATTAPDAVRDDRTPAAPDAVRAPAAPVRPRTPSPGAAAPSRSTSRAPRASSGPWRSPSTPTSWSRASAPGSPTGSASAPRRSTPATRAWCTGGSAAGAATASGPAAPPTTWRSSPSPAPWTPTRPPGTRCSPDRLPLQLRRRRQRPRAGPARRAPRTGALRPGPGRRHRPRGRRRPDLHPDPPVARGARQPHRHRRPHYSLYAAADGRHLAVAAIEPKLYRALLEQLGLADAEGLPDRADPASWPELRA